MTSAIDHLQEAVAAALRDWRKERDALQEAVRARDEIIHDQMDRIEVLEAVIIQMGGTIPAEDETAADVLES